MHRCASVHVPSNYIILFEVNRATSRAVIVFGYRNEKNLNEISSNQKGVIVLRSVSDFIVQNKALRRNLKTRAFTHG